MTYDEDYRAALHLQNVMVFSMARMPFRSILHTVLDLDADELKRVIVVGLVALRHLEIAQWRALLVAALAKQPPSTGEPDPHEEDRRTALAVLLAAKTLGDTSV